MDEKNLVHLLEANLGRQLHWIASCDSKGAFIFTLNAAMAGLLASVAPDHISAWTTGQAVSASFAITACSASFICLSLAAFPRTDGPKGSLVYCGGVAQREQEQFVAEIQKASLSGYAEDLAIQCHRNASIACEKFKWIQRALMALYCAVAPWALSVWLFYGSHEA